MGLHIVKRDACPLWKRCCFYLVAVLAALLLGGCLLFSMGVDPLTYYRQMFTMGVLDSYRPYTTYMNYIARFLPLALTSVALSLAFKMRFWNIGGEGQFIMGSVSAAYIALQFGSSLPQWATLLLMCVVAMAVAGGYGLIAGGLKVKFGTNETLLTLMLNYIALYFLEYLGETKADWNLFLQDTSNRPVFVNFSETVSFPFLPMAGNFKLNICLIFTLVIAILIYIYLKRTKQGYEISVVGDSSGTARYAGMKVNKIVLRTVFLSAALVGLAGAFKVGSVGVLSTAITDDVGWTGIIVAWLAQLNTGMIMLVSALICVLQQGSIEANAIFGQVDASFADMLQGAILFLVLVAEFFVRFRIARKQKGGKDHG